MTDIEAAVTYPTEREDWIKVVLIGGVLTFFGFLLVPIVLVYGYVVQVVRARFAGEAAPPAFEDWGTLFGDGVKAVLIWIAYMLIPLAVGGVIVGGALLAFASGTRGGAAAGLGSLLVGLGLMAVLSVVFGYFGTVGFLNFVREGRLGAAFDLATLKRFGFASEFAIPWLIAVGVFLAASFVSGILNVVPLLGAVASTFVFFYAQVVAAYLWTDGFVAARDRPGTATTDTVSQVG